MTWQIKVFESSNIFLSTSTISSTRWYSQTAFAFLKSFLKSRKPYCGRLTVNPSTLRWPDRVRTLANTTVPKTRHATSDLRCVSEGVFLSRRGLADEKRRRRNELLQSKRPKVADWDTPPNETGTIWTHPSLWKYVTSTYRCVRSALMAACHVGCGTNSCHCCCFLKLEALIRLNCIDFKGFSLDNVPSRRKQKPGRWNNPFQYKHFDNYPLKQSSKELKVTFHEARQLKGRRWKLGESTEF